MIITSKHEEREEKKKRARLVLQAGGCVAAPPAPPYASSLSVPSAGLRGSFSFAGDEHPPSNWRPRLLQGAGEVWAEAAIESEALLGTPALERCIRTNSRSLLRGAASICRPIPASGRDQIMHPGLRLQLISTGRCSRAQCFVLLCGRRSMRQLR